MTHDHHYSSGSSWATVSGKVSKIIYAIKFFKGNCIDCLQCTLLLKLFLKPSISEDDPNAIRSKQLDRENKRDFKQQQSITKLLLLGTGLKDIVWKLFCFVVCRRERKVYNSQADENNCQRSKQCSRIIWRREESSDCNNQKQHSGFNWGNFLQHFFSTNLVSRPCSMLP